MATRSLVTADSTAGWAQSDKTAWVGTVKGGTYVGRAG